MGLLDMGPQDEALLTLGLGLLNSRGSFGNALGQAGMQSLQTLNQAKDRQRVEKMRELQEEMARMNMETARRQQALDSVVPQFRRPDFMDDRDVGMPGEASPSPDLAGMANRYMSMPGGLQRGLDLQQMLRKQQPKLQAFKPGDVVGAQDDTGAFREQFRVPDKTEKVDPNKPFMLIDGKIVPNPDYQKYAEKVARAGASNVSVSTFPPVAGVGPDGKPAFVMIDKTTGLPTVVPGVRPPKTGAEEKAEQDKATRDRQSKQMLSAIDDAEKILNAGQATASGVGQKIDEVARVFGGTTKGAQDAARLEALSGWLVANVPRMEGPQSNYDVQNYMRMAGKVGDSTVPIAERKAALAEVRRLQGKYSAINGTPQAPASGWSIKKVE